MNDTTTSPIASATNGNVISNPAPDLRHRRHTLNPNRTLLDKFGIAAQTGMEWSVARVSRHGDPHIYDTRLFPWAAEVEREWRLIRAELDAVMTFRDQMPSFQDILKEVGAIQSDNNWKTFFLSGIDREGEALIFDDTYNHEVWNDTEGYRVVLFVDFARPLYQPFDWMNQRLVNLGALAPFLREAGEKQKRWQDAFWKKK